MCGILGVIKNSKSRINEYSINGIRHRGPDTQGVYSNENVFLAHTRLSILDLSSAGSQPMTSEDERYTLIYNGEIYNHLELRKTLTPGIVYNGQSDTETLLRAWILHGKSILPLLNGFFAFAIYDKEERSVVLARDRFGIKPLYYLASTSLIAFASELKAISDVPGHDKRVNFAALSDYLTLLYATGDKTPFLNIKKLLPGHYIEVNTKTIQVSDIQNFVKSQKTTLYNFQTENQWKEELEHHLSEALKRQLLSDVPIGYFLSGGLDSSCISAMARNQLGNEARIEAFCLDAEGLSLEDGFAEDINYAKKVSHHLNISLNIISRNSLNLENEFDEIIYQLDEPMADAAALNLNLICKTAHSKGYKVLMSGTGADELFGGYKRHQALRLEPILTMMPETLKRGLYKLGKLLPDQNPTLRRSKKLLNTFAMDKEERLISYHDWLNYQSVLQLFQKDILKELEGNYNPHLYFKNIIKDSQPFTNDLELMLTLERATYLPDNGLLYTDKMSMRHGVEVRVPFLDNGLAEFASQIPAQFRLNKSTTKYLLKKLMESYLPNDVVYRPKTGFGGPVRHWIKKDLIGKIKDYLSPDSLTKRGIFNPKAVWQLINANKASKIDASHSIWALLAIESWMRRYIDE